MIIISLLHNFFKSIVCKDFCVLLSSNDVSHKYEFNVVSSFSSSDVDSFCNESLDERDEEEEAMGDDDDRGIVFFCCRL